MDQTEAESTRFIWDVGLVVGGLMIGWILGIVSPFIERFFRRKWEGPKLMLKRRIEEVATDQIDVLQTYVSVQVENVMPRMARECRGYLLKIEKMSGDIATRAIYDGTAQCIWEFDDERDSFDVPQGAKPSFNVVMYQKGEQNFSLRIRRSDGHPLVLGPYEHEFRSIGKFRFSGVVTADELESLPFAFDVDATDWPPVFGEIA